ncbi:porin [Paracoccus amoyensis]|nr:porin [Paracoccus amoyensis]
MKKALIASTALVLTAGVAAADVTISGYGRTGVIYYEDAAGRGLGGEGSNETQVISRLRMNIDASTSSDQGVDFGARFRLQWDQNAENEGQLNAGKLWVTSNGFTVEVGNIDTAFDSAGLMYASELGSYDFSAGGNPLGDFFAYESNSLADPEYNGVRVVYSVGDLTVQASYVDPDQSGVDYFDIDGDGIIDAVSTEGRDGKEEIGFAVDYVWNERLELSAAAVLNGNGFDDNDQYFVGARYAVMDNARIGLNYYDNGDVYWINHEDNDLGKTITLYGDYTLADGLTNIEAYIANNSGDWDAKETDNSFGIGVNYDLGGARLGASLQRDYNERVTADMGVRFDF